MFTLSQAQKILAASHTVCVIKPDALGDFILALPALWALRRTYPQKKIVLLVSPVVFPLARTFDVADCILPVPLFNGPQGDVASIQRHALAIRTLIPDLDSCFILRWDADYYSATPLGYAMNPGILVGNSTACSATKAAVNPGYDNFLTHALSDTTVEHECTQYLKLLGFEGDQFPYPKPRAPGDSASLLANQQSIPEGAFIAVGVSASKPKKKLNAQTWTNVLGLIANHFKQPLVLLGGPEDQALGDSISASVAAINMCGKVKLEDTIPLLSSAVGAIAVDSFVKHAAACAGIPVVELSCQAHGGNPLAEYGGVRFGAWGVPQRTIKPPQALDACPIDGCVQDNSHCINGIEPTAVLQACIAVFPLPST